ncbi:hypothetical protein Hanom_Chr08g00749081 [Helianthus anomalus]
MGYGGAWVGGHEFGLAIESLPCHLLARHVTLLPRPTPGLKAKPKGATPQPKPPPGVVAWAFYPNPSPIPHGLINQL